MKNAKLYFLVGLIALSSYLLQRALLILSGQLDIEQSQAQPQTRGAFAGLDLSFSYLGMNIYWPFIIAIFLFGYKKTAALGDAADFLNEFEKLRTFKYSILIVLPVIALTLHYFSIAEFTGEQLLTVFGPLEDRALMGQGTIRAPTIELRVAAFVIVLGTLASLVASIYALFSSFRQTD